MAVSLIYASAINSLPRLPVEISVIANLLIQQLLLLRLAYAVEKRIAVWQRCCFGLILARVDSLDAPHALLLLSMLALHPAAIAVAVSVVGWLCRRHNRHA